MNTKLTTYSDGGARGNPGPAGIGFVIYGEHSNILENVGMSIGTATNNQAEYKALLAALQAALKLGALEVDCYLDSELVVKQLQGKYKIKEEGLKPLASEVLKLTARFEKIQFHHIPREKNKLADKLLNQALDEAGF
jgi:ribonuclease HI